MILGTISPEPKATRVVGKDMTAKDMYEISWCVFNGNTSSSAKYPYVLHDHNGDLSDCPCKVSSCG